MAGQWCLQSLGASKAYRYREPLCRFLGKQVPQEPFPNGNAPPEFMISMGRMMEERTKRGNRKLAAVISLVVGLLAIASAYACYTNLCVLG